MLGMLMVILAFNYVDRLALGLLLQDIKADLHASDTQLGLLSGVAFALFYSVMGIPIARWADRGNRVTIIGITTLLWSAAVALSGIAASFMQLLVIRIGVAVGEAGCVPPAHSLIADYFKRDERPRAVAIYMLGGSLSVVIGYFVAGWLNEIYGWRVTFAALGLPGVLLAALSWFTLREPRVQERRKRTTAHLALARRAAVSRSSPVTPSLAQTFAILWANTTFRHLLFCFSVMYFFGNGVWKWQPAFFMRSFGLQTGELGTWFAVIYGVGGLVGTWWGGQWAARHAVNNERLQLRTMAVVYLIFGALQALIYVSPNRYVALALLGVTTAGTAAVGGPLFATIQTLIPPHMRAVSIAVVYLFANLIGTGLGPLFAGALSDALRPTLGEESLRYALLALCPGCLWVTWHLWQASTTVTHDLAAANSERRQEQTYEYS